MQFSVGKRLFSSNDISVLLAAVSLRALFPIFDRRNMVPIQEETLFSHQSSGGRHFSVFPTVKRLFSSGSVQGTTLCLVETVEKMIFIQ